MTRTYETPTNQVDTRLTADVMHVNVPAIIQNDYDGTLGITGRLPQDGRSVEGAIGLLLSIAASDDFALHPTIILDAWEAAEDSVGSFDSLGLVKQHLSDEAYQMFCARYAANETGIDLLYPDARRYLNELNRDFAVPNNTLTYGNRDWQLAKTSAARVPGHVEITSRKHKGPVIEEMRGPEGTFDFAATTTDNKLVAIIHARKAILIDDKPTSFEDLPEDCSGILMDRLEGTKQSKVGSVNSGQVATVHSFDEIAGLSKTFGVYDKHPKLDMQSRRIMRVVTKYMPLASFAALQP
jgi:hypothetical protein